MKKIISVVLALLILFSVVKENDIYVEASAKIKFDKSQVLYLNKGFNYNEDYILISGLKKNQKLSKIKNSNNSVMTFERTIYNRLVNNKKISECHIMFKLKKPGKTVVSFYIGKKRYKINVSLKYFTNPVKEFRVSGVKNNKNLIEYTKKVKLEKFVLGDFGCHVDGLKNIKTKSSTVTIVPKKGWKVIRLFYSAKDFSYGESKRYKHHYYDYSHWTGYKIMKAGKTTLDIGGIISEPGAIYVDMVDKYGNIGRVFLGLNNR